MKMTMKHGALALALLGSAALFAGPTLANSLHDEGDFGGGYRIIGPGGPERHYYLRHHVFRPYDERPFTATATAMARRGATITTAHPSTTAPASINADAVGVPIWTN